MKAVRTALAVTLVLALGAAAWIGVAYWTGSDPATAAELVASAQADKQSLLDGIREGRPLYFKYDDFRKGRLAPSLRGKSGPSYHPDRVIQEEWLRAG